MHIATGERDVLEAARKAADGLASAVRNDGFLSGRLDEHWRDRVRWTCLTGSAQVAHSLLRLSQLTAETRYHEAASRLLSFVRRTVQLDAPTGIRGGVKGSHPVDGFYCRYEYPNWACKFLLDAITLEQEMMAPVGQSAVA